MADKKSKIAVAVSGGVDSGVVAALLVKQGYKCAGFHMHLWHETGMPNTECKGYNKKFENKCCSTESLEAARKTCHQLGIPFYPVNLSDIFKKKVVDSFLSEYGSGLTPNPCITCNKFIKFGELLAYIRKLGFDYLATGHYARIKTDGGKTNKVYHLLQAKDKLKDQSYFLYNLQQKQLAHVLFPIGDYKKIQVRKMAKEWGLPVAEKPESQEICFFAENDYREFLKRQISQKIIPGKVINAQEKVIGNHFGLPLYTIGQRHGFDVVSKSIGPFYVIGKDVKKNRLIVGFGKETETKEFLVGDVSWITKKPLQNSFSSKVRIRHQGNLLPAMVNCKDDGCAVILEDPLRGIASGQSAVFYEGEEVLGGGVIIC